MSKRHNRGLYEHLEATGVLERGNDLEIREAKKAYRKQYLTMQKQKQRASRPEFTVSFSNQNGEFGRLQNASKRHNRAITAFIREATMSYITKTYIVPDKMGLAYIEQLLAEALNEIQKIVRQKERFSFEREQKYEAIELQITKLEREITEFICQPMPIELYVRKAITADPTLREQILNIITTYDHQNIDPQQSIVQGSA